MVTFKRIMSYFSYITLMIIGFSFLIIFSYVGIYLFVHTKDTIEHIWKFLQEKIPELKGHNPPTTLILLAIEIPSFIMVMLGIAIILLTQRTASAKRLAKKK